MTGINTASALTFLQKYDTNKDGLDRNELMQATIDSYYNVMGNLESENNSTENVIDSFKEFILAMELNKSFNAFSNASNSFLPSDNPNTISAFDMLKAASNDGNLYDISTEDIQAENNYRYRNNQQYPYAQNISSCPSSYTPVPMGTQPYPTYSTFTGATSQNTNTYFGMSLSNTNAPVDCFYG
ncbi:MAG: hypothetical protein AB7V50_10335 [Vampirovibrionia bacterium]